ncbi:MAG: TadE family protein [Burkholderiaceae bacterium]
MQPEIFIRFLRQPTQAGAALLEWLVAIPIVLLVGMGALQWALVLQAKHAVDFAAEQAVRYAVRDYGRGEAINAGLAAGLQPFWLLPAANLANARLSQGLNAGWVSWRRIHPASDVFSDFAEPARTRAGDLLAGDSELPNDNLRYRSQQVGRQSGISVQAANRLSVEFSYGIELSAPLINALIVRVMEIVDGCRPSDPLLIINTSLGQADPGARRSWTCGMYRAPAVVGGSPVWRLPVRVRAERWMQSPLRQSSAVNSASADGQTTVVPVIAPVATISGPDVLSPPPSGRPPVVGGNRQIGPGVSSDTDGRHTNPPGNNTGPPGDNPGDINARNPNFSNGGDNGSGVNGANNASRPRSALDRLSGRDSVDQPGQCHS